jgi:hypothetical protein
MSTLPIDSATPIAQLARSLFDVYDTNHDGKLGSDEFARLIAKLTGGTAAATAGTSATASANGTTPVWSSAASGRTPRNRMDGFDSAKIANESHRTPKYLFARVAQFADLSGVTDKASAEAVLRNMLPELQAAGLEVTDVRGDKLKVMWEGKEGWVDVVQGANSGSPSFQWLPVEG